MDAAAWTNSKRVFLEVAPLPPDERPAALRRLCEGDELLISHVESLLAGDLLSQDLFTVPGAAIGLPATAESLEDASPPLPFQLRDLKFESVLGAGRSGVVYKARQLSMHRDVAVKVFSPMVRPGGLSTRLRREIMAMGRVHHPGIAQVLSAESLAWPDGSVRSALMIEYVRGLRLSDYARSHALLVRDAIEIVLQICDAVAAAHRAGVVHHDVKPANILVEEDAGKLRVKLVDFGISAIVGDGALHGGASEVYGSVRYTAPERLNGTGAWAALDARSDIYSIGIVLGELTAAVHEASRLRHGPYGSDLSRITAKATAVQPRDRYGTIDAMAGDLRSFLARRPVMARPQSVGYSSVRFIQRNPLVATLIALAVSSCCGALWLQAQEAALTEQARNEAKEAASLLLNGVADGLKDEIGASAKHREILMRLLPSLEQFAARYPREPRTQSDLANLLSSLGDVLEQRGDLPQARATLTRAYFTRRLLADLAPDDPKMQADLSIAMVRLGDVDVPPFDIQPPSGWYQAALARDERLVEKWPRDGRLLSNLAFSYDRLAVQSLNRGWLPEATRLADRQLTVARELADLEPNTERSLRTLSAATAVQALLTATRRDSMGAAQLLRENLMLLTALNDIAPNQRGVHKMLVDTELSLASYMVAASSSTQYPREAVTLLAEAASRAAQLCAVDPTDPYAWDLYVRALTSRHEQLRFLGERDGAMSVRAELHNTLDDYDRECGDCDASQRVRARALIHEAAILRAAGDVDKASAMIRQLLPAAQRIFDTTHECGDASTVVELYMNLPDATPAERNIAVDIAHRAVGGKLQSSIHMRVRVVECLLLAMRYGEALEEIRSIRNSIPQGEAGLQGWLRDLEARCVQPTPPK